MFLYVYVFRVEPLILDRQLLCSSLGKAVSLLAASLVACSCLLVLRPLELPTIYDSMSVDVLVQLMCRQSCW